MTLGLNFTERVRKTLALAREEAALHKHGYVGTEHLVLGLIRDGEGVAASVIARLNVNPEDIRREVEELIGPRKADQATSPDLPYTVGSKSVVQLAMSEARDLGHTYVGTEHLLLGLLLEKEGIAADVLAGLGLTVDRVRASVLEILGTATVPRRPVNVLRWLLTISAALAAAIGLMLIFVPKDFVAPMGIVVDDRIATIAQAQGAILFGLGIINWLARDFRERRALWAILYGNFAVQLLSFAVVLRALVHGYVPTSALGAAAMHVLLGAAFVWQMSSLRSSS